MLSAQWLAEPVQHRASILVAVDTLGPVVSQAPLLGGILVVLAEGAEIGVEIGLGLGRWGCHCPGFPLSIKSALVRMDSAMSEAAVRSPISCM